MIGAALFSSASGEHETPQNLFDTLDAEFHFTLDAAATSANAKCDLFLTKEEDAFQFHWNGTGGAVWLNPPYGREVGRWVEKALEESRLGATVVVLLPARTDTAWFHDHILDKAEIRWVRGRLRFGNAKAGAPFPSMLVIFRPPAIEATDPREHVAHVLGVALKHHGAEAFDAFDTAGEEP